MHDLIVICIITIVIQLISDSMFTVSDYILFPAHKGLIASIFCQSGLSFKDSYLPTRSQQTNSSENEVRGSLALLRKCNSVLKSALNNSIVNTACNQCVGRSLLKILITELWEIASQLNIWQVTEQQRHTGAWGWTGTAEEWLLIGPGTLWGQQQSSSARRKRKVCFHISVAATHRFSIRWQMTRFTPCTLQISLSTAFASTSLTSPSSDLPLHMATVSSQFYPQPQLHEPPPHISLQPYIVHFSVSVYDAPARYVNEGNRIVACGEAAQGTSLTKLPVNFTLIQSADACLPAVCTCVCIRTEGGWMFVCLDEFFPSLSHITSSLAEISHNHISRSPSSSAASINMGQN